MTPRHTHPKPRFLWQGLLILLPVAVLAAVGFASLRNDRQLARHEAVQRAQAVADAVLEHFWRELLPGEPEPANSSTLQVDPNGRLVRPPPLDGPPPPEIFDLALLDQRQAQLWEEAQSGTAGGKSAPQQAKAWRAFLDSEPPAPFQPVALYASAVLALELNQAPDASAQFSRVLKDFPETRGESGLPLSVLSASKLLELEAKAAGSRSNEYPALLEAFCSNIVNRPLTITPLLLDRAAGQAGDASTIMTKWQRTWAEHEVGRTVYDAARHLMSRGVQVFWVSNSEPVNQSITNPRVSLTPLEFETTEWVLARGERPGTNRWFSFHSEPQLGLLAADLVERTKMLPPYCAMEVAVAGRKLRVFAPDTRMWRETGYFGRRGGGVKKEVMETGAREVLASAAKGDASQDLVRVRVLLASPSALFKAQRTRTIWFAGLIATSAAAAFLGLLAAWRAFGRQRLLNELKSNFVSSVSHELRAPIASVRLMAESLERGKITEEPKRQEYFRFISQECRRLSSLIENVLDFSRIDQGRKRYVFEPVDLRALVETTVKLMEPYAAERGIAIRAEPGTDGECQACVDSKAIQQALINLVDNAIKHSPRGEAVTVGLERIARKPVPSDCTNSLRGATWFSLWVEDHGEGIPAEEHQRIFERFYRLGSELRRETTGVGIGLSIVKHIVEGHAGRVIVRSAPGQGSRFTILIRADPAVAQSEKREA